MEVTNNEPQFTRGYYVLVTARSFGLAKDLIVSWKKKNHFHGALKDPSTPIGRIYQIAKNLYYEAKNDYKFHNQRYLAINLLSTCQKLDMLVRDFKSNETEHLDKTIRNPFESIKIQECFHKKSIMPKPYNGNGVDFENRCGRIEAR